MNTDKKSNTIRYIVLAIVLIVIAGGVFFLYKLNEKQTNKPAEVLFKEYEELESSYAKALSDIEKVSDADYDNLDEMKKELQGKINDLKNQKELIDLRHKKSEELYADLKQNLEDLKRSGIDTTASENIRFNDGTAEVILNSQEVADIYNQNEDLRKENEDLAKNLEIVRKYYEKEKSKNEQLNTRVEDINERLSELKSMGDNRMAEIEKLQKEKATYEDKLAKSNKLIEQQNQKLNTYVKKLRKANVECFFEYGKGAESIKIVLDNEGLPKTYYDYFVKEKPPVHINFKLNEGAFSGAPEKVHIKISNNNGVEVYSTSRTITNADLEIEVPGSKFDKGKYKIEARSATENLLQGEAYFFRILK